jgi:RNA-directed DNA polymerase
MQERLNQVLARLFGRDRSRSAAAPLQPADEIITQPLPVSLPLSTPPEIPPLPDVAESGPDVTATDNPSPEVSTTDEAELEPSDSPTMETDDYGVEESEDDDSEDDFEDEDFDEDVEEDTGEARQLGDRHYFGEEMWGVSARQLAADTNVERLSRFDLPVLHSETEVAAWLGISLTRLRWYTHDRPAERTWHYVRYAVPKHSGQGTRVILAPKPELKALQRKVLAGIVAKVPVAGTTHGFVSGRSPLTNAHQHTGKAVLLKLDLQDFFPSVTFKRVRGLFTALGYSFAVASTLALLCTEYDRQPFLRNSEQYFISVGPRHLVQGAPTSPGLANLVAWRLDRRLAGLARKRDFVYTRYADDLTFSGGDVEVAVHLGAAARRIIADEKFTVNTGKTRLLRRAGRQTVTGLVVNEQPATPRELRRRLRAILHNAAQGGLQGQNRDRRDNYTAYLSGLVAYVGSANPRHGEVLRRQLRRVMPPRS